MKLELKHVSPYLPFYLKCHAMGEFKFGTEDSDSPIPETFVLNGLLLNNKASIMYLGQKELIPLYELFPILRPLSDLYNNFEGDMSYIEILENDNEIDYWADNDLVMLEFNKCLIWELNLMPFGIMQKLFEWHFDVFGLIDKGLAIDINTL